ncbi:MAG TPA: retropepsin-like aspartic protease [Candidatus Baltobacteraceae bacterium]|nr:retropepsin-like aspartic protease [Candidatus Baltobacteraceae bacterium]
MKLTACLLGAALLANAPASPSPSGDAAFRRGDFAVAGAAYAAALAARPDDVDALVGLGTVRLYGGNLAAARSTLMKAAALAPSDARIAERLRSIARVESRPGDLRVTMDRSEVDVPFVVTDPLPMIRARIDGHDATLVIDTGATTIALSAAAARRFGIALHPAGQGVFAGGRTAAISAGRIDTVSFSGASVRGVPAGGLPAGMPTSLGGHDYDGVIGTTLLRQFLSTLDYPGARLILRPRADSARFEAAAAAHDDAIVPMWLVPDHFIFARARVDDAYDALFSIDTGGAGIGITLTKDALDAAGIEPDATKAVAGVGGGGAVRIVPFTAASVSLGTFSRRDVAGVYSPGGDPYGIFPFAVAGALTHGFFRSAALTFDFDAMELVVASR